jgi:hypothetical protein
MRGPFHSNEATLSFEWSELFVRMNLKIHSVVFEKTFG